MSSDNPEQEVELELSGQQLEALRELLKTTSDNETDVISDTSKKSSTKRDL